MLLALTLIAALLPGLRIGPSSVYWPNGGGSGTQLACGGDYVQGSRHIALRRARLGLCDRQAIICSWSTLRCTVAPVRDSGPWGAIRGRGPKDGYQVHVGLRPPVGWRWRGAVDLSRATWKALGRPGFLSGVLVLVLPWAVLGDGPDRT